MMLKQILNLQGVKRLEKKEKVRIKGGFFIDCLDDSPLCFLPGWGCNGQGECVPQE
ncbi:hypothetical protein [Spongiimicrobium salis]|uniref:hypothetical protein n=1 Tax=Spongiimicrobium salis TaxID=1667022 RepID=UPI00374CAC9F